MPHLGRCLSRNGAGQAEFLLTEGFLQLGALDEDQVRIDRQMGVEQGGDLRAEVPYGFLPRFKIKNRHARRQIGGTNRTGGGEKSEENECSESDYFGAHRCFNWDGV